MPVGRTQVKHAFIGSIFTIIIWEFARNILVWLELWRGKTLESHNLVSFVKPKHMSLPKVRYQSDISKTGPKQFSLRLRCNKPSLWTWLSLSKSDARWSDSFACLAAKQEYTFTATCSDDLSLSAFKKQLHIASLRDTF